MRWLTSNATQFPPAQSLLSSKHMLSDLMKTQCQKLAMERCAWTYVVYFFHNFHLIQFNLTRCWKWHVGATSQKSRSEQRHHFSTPVMPASFAIVKHDVMLANYIRQLSETDVQYNLVSANRQIFKQEQLFVVHRPVKETDANVWYWMCVTGVTTNFLQSPVAVPTMKTS